VGSKPTVTTAPPQSPDCGPTPALKAPPAGLTITLSLDKTTVARGEAVTMTVTAKNTTAGVIQHQFDGRKADLWVRSGPRTIWFDEYRQSSAQVVQTETFAPGESKTFVETWTQNVCSPDTPEPYSDSPPPAGQYTVQGAWHDVGGEWPSNSIALTITP
jgi:hypothetical protein